MPHINIKFFPVAISEETEQRLISELTETVSSALGCDKAVISIALEPVEQGDWQEQVYQPEIIERGHLLRKAPNY